jgi:hypothetical protein
MTRRWLLLLALAACASGDTRPPPPVVPAAAAPACLPTGTTTDYSLDTFDEHLVLCATRTNARYDLVHTACWNVDPRTAALTARADRGRAYFRCQDDRCGSDSDRDVISYDGTHRLIYDNKSTLTIATRAGAAVRTFPSPYGLGPQLVRGILTYVGDLLFIDVADDPNNAAGAAVILDDHGHKLVRVEGTDVEVMDAGHVMVNEEGADAATIFDVATRAHRRVVLPGEFARNSVAFQGGLYALDRTQLVALDPRTFVVRGQLALPACR